MKKKAKKVDPYSWMKTTFPYMYWAQQVAAERGKKETERLLKLPPNTL